MNQPALVSPHREVAPLKLFFDLVFVFAISQLAHHLVTHLTWRGGLETLIALVAVCGVWAFTSFEITLLTSSAPAPAQWRSSSWGWACS